ncbi:MAG: hypothetical protein GX214_06365 [Clostridiales bacterium]|nr:hypothetical protein [Clostridiales bacterium]
MLSRKKRKIITKSRAAFIILLFLTIGFLIGYYQSYLQNKREEHLAKEHNLEFDEKSIKSEIELQPKENYNTKLEDNEDTIVNKQEDSIINTTNIIYKNIYNLCQDIMEASSPPSPDMIGLNELGFRKYLASESPTFEIISFSDEEVIILKENENACPSHYNHYLIKAQGGFINIYLINEEGEKILIEKTSISSTTLPYVDQKKLEKGIFKKTKEEIYRLLEDYM